MATELVEVIREKMIEKDVPGISLASIRNGKIDLVQSFGVKEYGSGDSVTTHTLFQAASISKPTTGLATLRLVSEGVLDLDRDVNDYLKSWKVPRSGAWQPRLTLRQLMSHTAGTTVHGFPGYPRDRKIPTLKQVLNGEYPANSPRVTVDLLPGTQFRYSGGGTSVMQQLLSDVTGMPFDEMIAELVFRPLQMDHSTFAQPLPERLCGTESAGHWSRGEPISGRWHVYPEQAAAGLWTTPTDLCKMLISIQAARAGRPHPFLSRHVIDEALSVQGHGAYGLGFRLEGTGANLRFGHTGSNAGFKAVVIAYVDQGLGACIMTNADNGHEVYAAALECLSAEYGWPGYVPEPPTLKQPAAEAVERYAGVYLLPTGASVTVEAAGTELLVSLPAQDPIVFAAETETDFRAVGLSTTLKFEWSSDHSVSAMSVVQDGMTQRTTRV